LRKGGPRGTTVGAVRVNKSELTISDPDSPHARWLPVRRWYQDPDHKSDNNLCYGFGIEPEPWLADTSETSPPSARHAATGERFSFLDGSWTCEAVAGQVLGQDVFFFPGKKTLIWKTVKKKHDFRLACAGLDNEVFATFHGQKNGVIKFRYSLTEEQEISMMLVLCHRFEMERRLQKVEEALMRGEKKEWQERYHPQDVFGSYKQKPMGWS